MQIWRFVNVSYNIFEFRLVRYTWSVTASSRRLEGAN